MTTAAEAEQIAWAIEILVGQIRAKKMAELAVGAHWGKYSTFILNGQFRESGIRGRGGKGTGVIRNKCQSSHWVQNHHTAARPLPSQKG